MSPTCITREHFSARFLHRSAGMLVLEVSNEGSATVKPPSYSQRHYMHLHIRFLCMYFVACTVCNSQ